jgi:Mn-dependent DtxR family transcriptional regulator
MAKRRIGRVDENVYRAIKNALEEEPDTKRVAELFGISQSTVQCVQRNKSYSLYKDELVAKRKAKPSTLRDNVDEVQESLNWRELLTGLLFIVIALCIFVKVVWELFNV